MSEGNLLENQKQQQHHQQRQSHKAIFGSSRDSELELLDTTATTTPATSSPELRSRSQSVSSVHREALLFFEQHRLFQNSPDLFDFGKEQDQLLDQDCELRSISSCSRTSSPAGRINQPTNGHGQYHQHQQLQKYGNKNLQQVQQQQQSQHRYQKKKSNLRQQSDNNLLESSDNCSAVVATASGSAGRSSGVNQQNISHSFGEADGREGRARSQSQGQCDSVRRRQDSCSSSVIIINTSSKKGGESTYNREEPHKASKWLQEIQFTAQYQHYRTNNYASVVSSASSLDKSDGSGGDQLLAPGQKEASEAERGRSSSSSRGASSSVSRHHHHQHYQEGEDCGGDNQEGAPLVGGATDGKQCTNVDDLNRQNSITAKQCWNFPRVKLKKLFTAKSLDDILGSSGREGSGSRGQGRKSLQVAAAACAQEEVSGEKSSSSPEFICRSTSASSHYPTKKAQLLRDNKLSLPRIHHQDDGTQLLIVQPARDGSKSPGAHSSKSAIVISTTAKPASAGSKQRKGPSFIKATRQKSRSFSALTSALLSKVPGHSRSSANSPGSSTASTVPCTDSGFTGFFTKRQHPESKNTPPVIPAKKSGQVVPCAKSDNCLNRFVASATCAKFVDYFSSGPDTSSSKVSKSATSTTTFVEPFNAQQEHYPGTPSSSTSGVAAASCSSSAAASGVVTSQPRKWTAIKNKWDQKLQASGDRQKEIGASLASVSNNAQIFRKTHHHYSHPTRQRSNSLSPLDNPEERKSLDSLLEITSPSPTLQEVRFLDTPEIRYTSPIAARSSHGDFNVDDDDDDEDYSEPTLIEAPPRRSSRNNTIRLVRRDRDKDRGNCSRPTSAASSVCSSVSDATSYCSDCSECRDKQVELDQVEITTGAEKEMTRHHRSGGAAAVAPASSSGGGTKRSRDHQHQHRHGRHHHHHHHGASGSKPKLVVANVTYLQRPMSPGLLLRENSPSSSSPASAGTIDSFGNFIGASGTDTGAFPSSSSSAIRSNNVFNDGDNINNPASHHHQQQSKSQQAKLEFLKSLSPTSQQQGYSSDREIKSPLSPIDNLNRRQQQGHQRESDDIEIPGAFSTSISPSSSGGASDSKSSERFVAGAGVSHPSASSQVIFHDLQNRQQRGLCFTDENLGSAPYEGGPAKGVSFDDDNETRKRQKKPKNQYGGNVEHCRRGQNQPFSMDPSSEGGRVSHHPHHHQGATGLGGGGGMESDGRSRSSGNQFSGIDPINNITTSSSGTSGGGSTGRQFNSGDISFSLTQNQVDPLALAQQSSLNNNLHIDVDFEGTEDDTMGDLQSPQYVKRTAHMFDSRFSSTERGAGGNERNGRNPSYLNVSRSVSGYSCLTYNNGSVTSETATKSVLGNGTSLLTGSRVAAATPRIKTDFALHSPFSRNKVPNTDDDSSDHSSNQSATSPPPSLPPINPSVSHHGRYSESSFFQNGMNRGDELLEDTPYIPSHGKSFVMQRIERLYGSDASNKGVIGKKSSHVTTISISRDSPPRGVPERRIPIKVEPRDRLHNNLYNTNISTSKRIDINVEDRDGNKARNGSGFEGSALVLPGIRGSTDDHGRRVIEHRISHVSLEDSDEDENDTLRRRQKSPNNLQSVSPIIISKSDNSGNLNGNANRYRNGVTVSLSSTSNGRPLDTTTSTSNDKLSNIKSLKLEKVAHANGSNNHTDKIDVDEKVCVVVKKALSRESSAESDDTNGCSEASLELASISDSESPNKSLTKDNSLYSNRGLTSPVKPKPKPKPKDMALLRTLSRSPGLKTGTDDVDKTAMSLNFSHSQNTVEVVSKVDDIISSEDQIDGDCTPALSDIKNTITTAEENIDVPSYEVTTKSSTPSPLGEKEIQLFDQTVNGKENTPSTEAVAVKDNTETLPAPSIAKDGNYFIGEMSKVTDAILRFSEKAAKELDELDPSDDRAGSIHAAIGKGNLLVKKKFKQFEELCQANLKGATADEPETTNEDLAGFWDMVMIQVDQIYSLFADLEKKDQKLEGPPTTSNKSSSPKRVSSSTSRPRPGVVPTPKANSAAAKARDEARRKMLAEKRRAMKNQMQETLETPTTDTGPEAEVHIFTSDAPQTG